MHTICCMLHVACCNGAVALFKAFDMEANNVLVVPVSVSVWTGIPLGRGRTTQSHTTGIVQWTPIILLQAHRVAHCR